MRNPLQKRIPRLFKENLGKYLGMFIILVCTILIGSAFMSTLESVTETLRYSDESDLLEDGQFESMEPISDTVKKYFSEKNILLDENYFSTDKDFEGTAKVLVFQERKLLNLPSVFEGELPKKENEIALDRLFAQNRNYSVGDTITLNDQEFIITATISLPDYSSLFKNNQDLVMNTNDFGVSLVTKEGLERFEESTMTYRYSYRFENQNLTLKQEREEATNIQKTLLLDGVKLQSFLTSENNQSITFLREDMGKDGPMVQVFIYILIAVIAFVFAILTNNTIESEATIIGTLRASGYRKSEIIFHYLTPTIIISIVSSIVGNVIGYTLMIQPFQNLYYTSYCIPPIDMQFSIKAFIITTIIPVAIMVLINWFLLYRKLSLNPLKFLRRDLKKGKQKKAVKLPELSFMTRFRLRVIIQNKISYLILFFGIFLSSFLLMFGIGMEPMMNHYVEEIDKTLPYEYQYILKQPVQLDQGEQLGVHTLDTWYELGMMNIDVTFMGVQQDSEFFASIELPQKDDEITITAPMAKKLGVKVGETLTFVDEYYEKEYTLTVIGICDYNSVIGAFMKQETFNQLLGYDQDYFNCYVSNEKLTIDDRYVLKYITRSDMVGAAKQMMTSFDTVITVLTVFSVAIYMVLMYILTKTVIEKNAISISFMKVFGYNGKEISQLYLHATTITVLVSLFICIPLEALCFKGAMIYIASMVEGYIEFYLPPWVYIAIIVTGIVAYFIINTMHVYKVKKIPMSAALKNRE